MHTVTPTTLKCLENTLNTLPQKIQLNKIQVVSAMKSVRRDEWVRGKDKEAEVPSDKRVHASVCVLVNLSFFFKHKPKFPQQVFSEVTRATNSNRASHPSA